MDYEGKVAVVTGGAGGIGRGLVHALLARGAQVVVADVEAPALGVAIDECAPLGSVRGVVTDVADSDSVVALAEDVYNREGRCDLLFANAGVTSGGGGLPWEQEINDWRWCFSVNVFGVAATVLTFLPRMLEAGSPGDIVATSSGDGGVAPVPYASVYAASKAAVSCFIEAVAHQLRKVGRPGQRARLLPRRRAPRHRAVDRRTQPPARASSGSGPALRLRGRRSPNSKPSSRRPGSRPRSSTSTGSAPRFSKTSTTGATSWAPTPTASGTSSMPGPTPSRRAHLPPTLLH